MSQRITTNPVTPLKEVALDAQQLTSDVGPNFCARDAHASFLKTLNSIAATHEKGAEIRGVLAAPAVGGPAREEQALNALALIGRDPDSIVELMKAARRDVQYGRNGNQMLRYVLNATYIPDANGDYFYSDEGIQRQVGLTITNAATDSATLQKYLGVFEGNYSPKGFERITQVGFSAGAIYEIATVNVNLEKPSITAAVDRFVASPGENHDAQIAAKLIAVHNDPTNTDKKEALAAALPVQPQAISRLKKALGLDAQTSTADTIAALITFNPEVTDADAAKGALVLQGAIAAMRLDPKHGQTLYEVAVTKLYNPDRDEASEKQVWGQPAIQRQFAKSMVALAKMGNRRKDLTPFVKSLTWYEGTFTAQQVGALLKQDMDPTVLQEMIIAKNIDIDRTYTNKKTGETKFSHREKLEEFLTRVDGLGQDASDNQKACAMIVRKALGKEAE